MVSRGSRQEAGDLSGPARSTMQPITCDEVGEDEDNKE